jgi:hypothetical protein
VSALRNALLALLALWSCWCAACEQLIGLKDRTFGDAGADVATSNPACPDYCKNSLQYCTADTGLDGYGVMEECIAVCNKLPPGKPGDQTGNSVACRANHASKAGGIESRASECPAASPGGGSPDAMGNKCGSNCEGYCSVYTKVCPDSDVAPEDCMRFCEALPDRGAYSAKTDYGVPTDTLQCRIAHLTAAATAKQDKNESDRKLHCGLPPSWGHSAIRPPLDGAGPFCDLIPFTRQCPDFCKLVISTCGQSFPVYDDEAQCEALCNGYELGTSSGDASNDTLACRRWHAYTALTLDLPRFHCSHAGPTGDGHCGSDKCESFCNLYKRTCDSQFKSDYGDKLDNCKADCQKLNGAGPTADDAAGYNLLDTEQINSNTYQCRTHQAALAAAAAAAKQDTKSMCMLASPKSTCMAK